MDFSHLTVLCVGDVMLDRFVYGDMERISPEAPVPVLRLNRTREMPGGVGNVANNILSLGGRAILIGLLGDDEAGATLRRLVAAQPRLEDAMVTTGARPTVCKTRFIAAHQQVVRTDEESRLALQPDEQVALIAGIEVWIGQADVLLLSDYAKGTLGKPVIARAIQLARAQGIPVFVDPKSADVARYHGATCIKPNARELAAASGLPVEEELEVVAAAQQVMRLAGADAILATRSEKGMMLVERSGAVHAVRSRAREIFDLSGAGDTVIATLALAYASGRSLEQSMHIANAAAGVVVGKLGTATADIAEVIEELDLQDQELGRLAPDAGSIAGLSSLPRVLGLVARWKEQGLRVGFTNGVFDILHPGHVALLAAARSACDRLVVGLNTDASVERLKGPSRPVNTLGARAQVIAAIRHVDAVVAFEDDTPLALIKALLPDVLVKGADYTADQVVGAREVEAAGGRLVLARLVPDISTTGTIARIRTATLLSQPAPS
ncbi:D-glycero-beta-D-manno-heptose-7-phosphate kinase [Lichenicola cladoniae]|uniref:Bifunctional protein HldE n=1 Tax=Lichenicola cladoniae TaxID=1484109 RepID=A0A6M8HSK2_9PROT|nr:D-glycero-beta-D-manno-heptose-7-phosphate kinase [Lichenicola cladoniae]NPD65821.1 D-glycero-beta-D-manno-heptose-7-phosphate kinase [Acetobacteraceae bacterium]QKE91171.1 D-glycero-beta-D-manno-heptose-7-phosphate kinase [Lichenicola cladoniae]